MNSIGSNQVEFEPTNKTKEKDNMKTISKAVAVASLISAGFIGTQAHAVEVSASAGVSNMYLWRGQNLGQVTDDNGDTTTAGVPAVFGDVVVSMGGLYAGMWTSSGDALGGQEYDLFVGYGGEAGDFSYDVNVATYIYPDGGTNDGTFGDSSEVIATVGFMGASVGVYKQVGDVADNDDIYYALGYGMGPVSATYGMADAGAEDADFAHFDVTYAYNDSLSFTASKIVSEEEEDTYDTDTKIQVTYSLPIE